MAHKSHRQKALQSQLEERPEISLITNEEKPKKARVPKKVKPTTTASALASSGSMDVDEPESESTTVSQVPEPQHVEDDDGDILIDNATASTSNTAPVASTSTSSGFAPLALAKTNGVLKNEFRRIPVPAHRMSPLRRDWVAMYTPMVEHLGLQVRMNEKRRCIEIRTSAHTVDSGSIQKGADFVKAYVLGFDVNDSLALLRLDDIYLDSFEIKDVKTLHGDHLARAIGRIAGEGGKVKFSIENASRTRIVLADTNVHILGSVQNIKIARDAVVSLILGSPPGKVYAHLKSVGARLKQRF